MDRTLVRDVEKPRALLDVERAYELDVALDTVEHSDLCLAILTVSCMNFRVPQTHSDRFERPLFSPCVQSYCHRDTTTESGEQ